MAEQFKMDQAYRDTDEYKGFVEAIKKEAPHLPLALIETAIIAHKTMPNFYKTDKQHKQVLSSPFKPPKNKGEIVVNAISVSDLTEDIVKQREEFWAKHMPKIEDTTTIEEIEA